MDESANEQDPPVLQRAREDIAAGRLWKARDRLTGALRTHPANQQILTLLGRVYYQMGDLPEAAKYWYLTNVDGPEMREAIGAFHQRYGRGARGFARGLPVRADLDEYPSAVANRLREVSHTDTYARKLWGKRARAAAGLPESSLGDRLKEAALVGVVLVLTVGVWVLGLLAILALIFGWDA